MRVEAIWEEGPRNEAWEELWRRLLAAVLERVAEEEAESGTDESEYDSRTNFSDTSPGDG